MKQPSTFGRTALVFITMLAILAAVPFAGDRFLVHVVMRSLIWAVVAVQWNLLMGYAGLYSFGNLFFFAIGGYVSGALAMNGIPIPVSILVGGLTSMLSGLAIGRLTLNLKGVYLAIFTFAAQEGFRHVAILPELTPLTGGPIGLQHIPRFSLTGLDKAMLDYTIVFAFFILVTLTMLLILRSKYGLVFRALKDSENFLTNLGVNVHRHRLVAFLVSALFTGFAGSIFAHVWGGFTDEMLSPTVMIDVLFMIALGGLGTFYGPIFGAFFLTSITEYSRAALYGELAVYRSIAVSALIPVMLKFLNRGVIGQIEYYLGERWRAKALEVKRATPL